MRSKLLGLGEQRVRIVVVEGGLLLGHFLRVKTGGVGVAAAVVRLGKAALVLPAARLASPPGAHGPAAAAGQAVSPEVTVSASACTRGRWWAP